MAKYKTTLDLSGLVFLALTLATTVGFGCLVISDLDHKLEASEQKRLTAEKLTNDAENRASIAESKLLQANEVIDKKNNELASCTIQPNFRNEKGYETTFASILPLDLSPVVWGILIFDAIGIAIFTSHNLHNKKPRH